MISWLCVTILLAIAGLAFPVYGALSAVFTSKESLQKAQFRRDKSQEISVEWSKALEPVRLAYKEKEISGKELSTQTNFINEEFAEKFREYNLPIPNAGAFGKDVFGYNVSTEIIELIYKGNLKNFIFILLGPVFSTAATIVALFPGWQSLN